MKYLIYSTDPVSELIGEILVKELSRFDIRSEIFTATSKEEGLQQLKNQSYDLLVEIAADAENRFTKLCRKTNTKRVLLHQSINHQKGDSSNTKVVDLIIRDLPGEMETLYFGSPLIDVVKSSSSIGESVVTDLPKVALIEEFGKSKGIVRSLEKLATNQFQLLKVDLVSDFGAGIRSIQNSHASIATGNLGELVSLQLNTPTIRVNRFSLFRKSDFSLLNTIADQPIILVHGQRQKVLIESSLGKILNDHNYCAGILQDYQSMKDQIGTEPSVRRIAQHLIDWLEQVKQL